MFRGVNHVGVGVGDMDLALDYYGRKLGFSEVLFDISGEIPGIAEITRRARRQARVVMLRSAHTTPLGPGLIKLVQVLDGEGPPPMPPGLIWGELGICEVCLHVRRTADVHKMLVGTTGCSPLMEPVSADFPPYDVSCDLSYVADPWEGKVELIEWTGLWRSLPGEPRLEGVNHVAFGVTDMAATREFYEKFGFTDLVFESNGYFEPMAPWFTGPMPRQHVLLALPGQGAGIEPARQEGEIRDCRGEWGHVGPMEFAIGVTNIDQAFRHLQAEGIEFHSAPQTIDVGTGEWRYAYFKDPDGIFVSIVEPRF